LVRFFSFKISYHAMENALDIVCQVIRATQLLGLRV